MPTLLVTGSSGLIGSEVVAHFIGAGWTVHGIDNNSRARFFGEAGDTRWNRNRLLKFPRFHHHDLDIRDRSAMARMMRRTCPDAIVHAAAQPSHDLAAGIPLDDFDTNAGGTMNLLEAARRFCIESPFIFLSTNKVYGDFPNRIELKELSTRYDFDFIGDEDGFDENTPIDQSTHSVFGASKVAADVMVQEYGRYFGMPTCCLRGGCLTGPNHSGVELHGFLSYLIKCCLEGRKYTIYGHLGKQVRDNIHAYDVARLIEQYIAAPQCGEVYNVGGGRENSISLMEAITRIEGLSGQKMHYEYVDRAREGDHICWISDIGKARQHYPKWGITRSLDNIFTEIRDAWMGKLRTA